MTNDPDLADDHVLPASALQGINLPAATKKALSTVGVPVELRLGNWPGPTLFSSELGAGKLVSTANDDALVKRKGMLEGYIFGSVRDTRGAVKAPYSVFVLRKEAGDVFLLDALDPGEDRFVASSLDAFLAAMGAFEKAWPHLSDDEEGEKALESFRKLLLKIDPEALAQEHNYWPGWFAELV